MLRAKKPAVLKSPWGFLARIRSRAKKPTLCKKSLSRLILISYANICDKGLLIIENENKNNCQTFIEIYQNNLQLDFNEILQE